MNQIWVNYGIVLDGLNIPAECVITARDILLENPAVKAALVNPTIPISRKHRLIERIFPVELHNFCKKVCDNQDFDGIDEIFTAWQQYRDRQDGILEAVLYYVVPPDQQQRQAIIELLKKRHKCRQVRLQMQAAPELLGGFIIRAGNYEYDRSLRGRLARMKQKITRR